MFKDNQLAFVLILVTVMGVSTGIWYLYTTGINVEKLNPVTALQKNQPTYKILGQLRISSPAFTNGADIPINYTCKGVDINPPLQISGVTEEAKSLLLIVDDPGAPMGSFDHWVVFNIDPKVTVINDDSIPTGGILGQNSFGKGGYSGPCPSKGIHTYHFKIYSLDTILDLPAGTTKKTLNNIVLSHIIDKVELTGTFGK